MRYKMRVVASGVNGDKGRKGERRSESEGREGEVGKLIDGMRREGDGRGGKEIEGRKYYLCFFVQVVVAVCICQNIECLTG